jgi:hypothetical protein
MSPVVMSFSRNMGFTGQQNECAIEGMLVILTEELFENNYLEYIRDETDLKVTNLFNKGSNDYRSQKSW